MPHARNLRQTPPPRKKLALACRILGHRDTAYRQYPGRDRTWMCGCRRCGRVDFLGGGEGDED